MLGQDVADLKLMNLQKIDKIREIVIERIDEILDFFQIEYKSTDKYYSFSCPIHCSDRHDSCSIYKNSGKWGCWTAACHQDYGNDILSFVKGLLQSEGKRRNIEEVANLCLSILKADISNFREIEDYNLKVQSNRLVNNIIKQRKLLEGKILRKTIRERLYIPADYYINRGYTKEILDKYDVGLCNSFGKEMFGRIVVPVYNDDYSFMVGCLGRSKYSQCKECGRFHSEKRKCPNNITEQIWSSKWKNSKGFAAEHYLYNYWFAKKYIEESKNVVIVEGQGDVWRLEEAGIHCSVGVFGDKITDGQKLILEQSGAQNIIIASDNDSAGEQFREKVKKQCGRLFNIIDVRTNAKDFGEMTIEETKKTMLPIIERLI